ncbi:gamma-glutamyltransferase family protein [Paenibacillus cremeus]|uniref:Gamma-glutamyltransferase family protein n=1 Tax=Paenibacillus cremeus TaxID=2163881 RepID=A0A559K7A9_9BACL|nr:gamma-glutamyltransferase family protein [Paenibacillus cremeus]TVY08020.1 gamma-glutamyltransferase family protein [Paenibacillus cremeus]
MLNYDPLYHPFGSQRVVTYARKGIVATSQPLAAQAGLDILKKGGNAIDAAIATAAALIVVEPHSNSFGGDTFAIVWTQGKLHGLNSSGPAPRSISIEAVKKMGYDRIPGSGMLPITVPGTPAAWVALSERFGKLPLTEVLKPAIEYAEQGYPISPYIAKSWKLKYDINKESLTGKEFEPWFQTYAPNGRPPQSGEMWSSADHARTMQAIAETKAEAFYRGELADKIHDYIKQFGGFLTKEDLAEFRPEWVDPIKVTYKGYDIWELPPNGQGLVVLMALNMLKDYEWADMHSADTYHKQIEAIKLAFADGLKYITDPKRMKCSVENLLSDNYTQLRRSLISDVALQPEPGEPQPGGTVYLAAADGDGNMVSLIQSHAGDFGSSIVIPGTGICMQNRGSGFSLNPDHHNCLEPGKRTYHTIIPGFITYRNQPVGPFGITGGMTQPQAHVQVVSSMIDFHLNPQAALDKPRWRWVKDKTVEFEPGFPDHVAQAIARKGHHVQRAMDAFNFGRGQVILKDLHTDVLAAATDPRVDGAIAAW